MGKDITRFFILTMILSFCVCGGKGELLDLRHRKINVVDTAYNEVVYVHIAVDPYKKNPRVTYEMLSIGKRFHKYGGYDDYQMDSTFMSDPDFNPNHEEYVEWGRQFEDTRQDVVINLETNTIDYYYNKFWYCNRYSEPIPEFAWELEDGEEDVIGYRCRKARVKWRGREWTAWYSDIPVDAGPWKFRRLPGLILKMEDATGQHKIEAIGTKDDVYPMGYVDSLYSRRTREFAQKAEKDYCENFGKIIADSGMLLEPEEELKRLRRSNKRRFYAPIEIVGAE